MSNPFRRSGEPNIAGIQLDSDLATAIDRITTHMEPTDRSGGRFLSEGPDLSPPFTNYYDLPDLYLIDHNKSEGGIAPEADVPHRVTLIGVAGPEDLSLTQTPTLNGEMIVSRVNLSGKRRANRLVRKVIDFSQQFPE